MSENNAKYSNALEIIEMNTRQKIELPNMSISIPQKLQKKLTLFNRAHEIRFEGFRCF